MGLPLTGYRDVRLLRASGQSRVYEAVRRSDGRPVIAKVFDLGPEDIEPRVEHEFSLLEALQIEGVVRPLSMKRVGEQLVLLLERAPGLNLAAYASGRPLQLQRFMAIAIQLADILERIHGRRIIHRDIKPTNILIHPETGEIKVADFGISVLLESERRHIYDPDVLEGTLPYISPEQTGRTGRPVDFRSDLYSLGVTFYELLTAHRPFAYAAPLEVIHGHLARVPASPQLYRPGLPDGLSRLVLKLLAKAPEHRYQTAAGLATDLRQLGVLLDGDDEGAAFELGRGDLPRELQLPHQLYGRESERAELVEEIERVVQTGYAHMMLLRGPAGVGKSALIADFQGEVARFGSYVARGEFARDRERPYSAFVEAFGGLVEQLLTQSESRLEHMRVCLGVALGAIAKVVVELAPTLELVIGEQPELAALEPREARNRLHFAVTRFLSVFCDDGRPLVLVLENLQWADQSSLALLEALADGGRQGATLILGSFRDAELGAEHPLHELLARFPEDRLHIASLEPLKPEAVERLLAETLARPRAEVRGLSKLVARKTDNNPLFIRQLLTHLAEAGLLRPGERGWSWDDDALGAAAIPDDALGVISAKLAALDSRASELLQHAACVGDRFDLATLRVVHEAPSAELTSILYDLIDAGLINPFGGEYRFAHDGIREAAQRQAGAELRQRVHWQIGRHWLGGLDSSTDERLFEVVDHLDAGLMDIWALEPAERVELAELNLRAGRRALDSAAYDPALRYLEQGIALVVDHRDAVAERGEGAAHYELLVDLHFACALALAMRERRSQAEEAFVSLLGWRLGLREYGRVAATWVAQLNLAGRNAEAVAFGVAGLVAHGCPVELSRSSQGARAELEGAWDSVRELDLAQLMAMPRCEDGRAAVVMELLVPTKHAAYVINPNLYVALVSVHIRWFLRHGRYPSVCLGIAQLAICVGSMLGEVEGAIRTADHAMALAERFESAPVQVRVESATQLFVAHLGRPFAEPLARMGDVNTRALEAGDFLWAGYTGAVALAMHLEVGMHLQVLGRLSQRFDRELGSRASAEAGVVASTLHALGVMLGAGSEGDTLEHARETLDPAALEARGGSRYSIYVTVANRALVGLLLGEVDSALRSCLAIIDTIEQVLFASWVIPRVALTALVAVETLRGDGEALPEGSDEGAARALAIIRRWAQNSSDNYAHYRDLAEGLCALGHGSGQRGSPQTGSQREGSGSGRLGSPRTGSLGEALRLLERARAHASERGCRWVEGLAAEQLAKLADRDGLSGYAAGARQQACQAYAAWGASAKLEQLRSAHAEELAPLADAGTTSSGSSSERRSERSSEGTPGRRGSVGALDFDSVLRSVAEIGTDLRLDQVIEAVLGAAITNAGADHGLLVMERDGVLGIVAEAEIDGARLVLSKALPLSQARDRGPTSLIHYVLRTTQALVLDDAGADLRFCEDPYVRAVGVLSLLGMPIMQGKRTQGVLVLENRLSRSCFTADRLEVLQLIVRQAASALEHARVHAALREGEARWRSLVDGAPDIIALIDELGELEFLNRSGMAAAGLSEAEPVAGDRVRSLFSSSPSAPQWREAIDSVLREGVFRELELELPREVGPSRWYVARLAPIEVDADPDGRLRANGDDEVDTAIGPRKAIAIATDISARKQAEIEKRALETQVRQQQRLESLGTLASGVAHEINNPIQGIMNYAELISARPGERGLVQEFSAEISHEAERVATIVRNLLAFSRYEGQPIVEVDIGGLVEDTLSLIHSVVYKDHITMDVAIPQDLPKVSCRAQQIQQIVMNLVTNARDALNTIYSGYDQRKRIEIRAERLESAEAAGRAYVRLTVEDQGPGIPADVLPRIFDPFFTTKGRDQGTGLGLAVSHGIAQEHGGELSVDSGSDRGTRFYLDLPLGDQVG